MKKLLREPLLHFLMIGGLLFGTYAWRKHGVAGDLQPRQVGFEWTSNTGGNNLHRNILFRENGAKASLVEPFTTMAPFGSQLNAGEPRGLVRPFLRPGPAREFAGETKSLCKTEILIMKKTYNQTSSSPASRI